jgi:hypothetical protein
MSIIRGNSIGAADRLLLPIQSRSPGQEGLSIHSEANMGSVSLSAKVSRGARAMHGRKVDVLLSAPNLMRLPIHDMAFKEGKLL